MPTENRSSNTEGWIACDDGLHLIQMDKNLSHYGWVFRKIDGGLPYSVREATPHEMAHAQARQHLRIGVAQIAGQAPAPRPHPEPIAWMVGTAIWWTKEEAERDAAATGLPIVGLGPMAGVAPAEQNQSEPVGVESATFMGEPNFQHSIEWCREGISKHWKKICDLRAEVERLRAALKFYADREHYHFESGNWDTVSGEPLNILWCGDDPDFIENGTVARNALSASAEPSAPIAWHVGGNGYDRICFEKPDDLPGRPCIQAIHDQRQLIDLLKRYDLRDEDVPPDERAHGIPGTSFQRLNMLANQGE